MAALPAEAPGTDPFSSVSPMFRSRRANQAKFQIWDGSGLVLVWKHLEGSSFRWPLVVDSALRLTPVGLAALFGGIVWTPLQATREIPRSSAPA